MSGCNLVCSRDDEKGEAEREEGDLIAPVSHRRGERKRCCQNNCQALMLQKDRRAQLKDHYCGSESTPLSHVASDK